MRGLLFLLLTAALAIGTGCGDDGGGGGDTGTADTGTTDTGTSDTGTTDTGTSDTGTSDTGTMSDGGGGDGGGGDGGGGDGGGDGGSASAAATAYCTGYETTCGYSSSTDRFADAAACTSYYDSASMACTTCMAEHLGYASMDADTHCPHATGMGPCAGDCP